MEYLMYSVIATILLWICWRAFIKGALQCWALRKKGYQEWEIFFIQSYIKQRKRHGYSQAQAAGEAGYWLGKLQAKLRLGTVNLEDGSLKRACMEIIEGAIYDTFKPIDLQALERQALQAGI